MRAATYTALSPLAAVVLFVAGAFLEGYSLSVICFEAYYANPLSLSLLSHVAASLLFALTLTRLLPPEHAGQHDRGLALFFFVSLFIPVLGPAGCALVLLPSLYSHKSRARQLTKRTGIPELPYQPADASEDALYGEGGINAMLRNVADPHKRLRGIMAARQINDDKIAVSIFRQGIKDESEEVILLSYASLNEMELVIDERIRANIAKLATGAPADRSGTHVKIAMGFWEMAYLGLAEGEVRAHVLKQAKDHYDKAIELAPDEPGGHFALARVFLALDEADQARDCFERAMRLGWSEEKCASYLAEIAFEKRQFDLVRKYLTMIDAATRSQYPLSLMANYWL